MNLEEINFIRGCLPSGRTKFLTYKDQYAAKLLSWKMGDKSLSVAQLKRDPSCAPFMRKPVVQDLIKSHDGQKVSAETLNLWPNFKTVHAFRLTLDEWGNTYSNWNQTSRRGHNLVLQLNFPKSHGSEYRKLGREKKDPCDFIS